MTPADLETQQHTEDVARRVAQHYLIGATAGMLILMFVLFAGTFSLLQRSPSGLMYDAQARSMLHGRWDVPQAISSIETFTSRGKSFIYFGPFPALLRMPLLLMTSRFDGRLSQLSMVLAFVVTMAASTSVVGEVVRRCDLRVVTRFTKLLFTVLGFVFTGGSVVTFLAFRGDIYNEAIAWGLATALASIAALLRALRTGSARTLLVAGLLAAAAIESRITMGASATGALAMTLVWSLRKRSAYTLEYPQAESDGRSPALLARAAAVPVITFLAVQVSKWHSLLVVPSQHIINHASPQFGDYLADHGDTYFSASFVPTNFLASVLWPPAMHLTRVFPWIARVDTDFGPSPGHPRFLGRAWTGSLACSQTVLFALAVIGAAVLRPRGARRTMRLGKLGAQQRELRMVVIGASVGFVGTLAYAYQYHRFLADALPVVLLLAAVGGAALAGRIRTAGSRRAVAAVLCVAAVWSVWINLASALLAQTSRAFAPSAAAVEQLTHIQADLGAVPTIVDVGADDPLPPTAAVGTLAVVGRCDALFASAGTEGFGATWWPVVLGPRYKRAVDVDTHLLPGSGASTIVSDGTTTFSIGRDGTGAAELVVTVAGQPTSVVLGRGTRRIGLEVRPVWASLAVTVEGRTIDVPWSGHLPSGAFTGIPGITDRGADDMSTCRNAQAVGG